MPSCFPAYPPSFPRADQDRLWEALANGDEATVRAIVLADGFPAVELRTTLHLDTGISYLAQAIVHQVSWEDPLYPTGILQAMIEAGALPSPQTAAAERFQVTHLRNGYLDRTRGIALVQQFDRLGMPINGQDDRGKTLLYWAAWAGQHGWTQALLEAGADPTIGAPAWAIEVFHGDNFGPEVRACGALCQAVAVSRAREAALAQQAPSATRHRRPRS